MLTVQTIYELLMDRSAAADASLDKLYDAVEKAAETERDYKREKAKALLESAATPDPMTGKKKTVAVVEAEVDEAVEHWRFEAHLAEGMRHAAYQEVKLRVTQLSAAQTVAGAFREEVELGRKSPS